MKAIIPLSPPSYKQGNLPGNVKDLCAYARNLQEQVDFYLGQLQKACEDANEAVEQIQKGVESINALYNYSEEGKKLNIIPATSFNSAVAVGGRLTASGDLAVNGTFAANNGGYFRGFSLVQGGFAASDGSNGYIQVMTIAITGTYANSPIIFEFTRRGYAPVRGYIRFKNANSRDPELESAVHEGELNTPFYLVKSATSTWKVYIQTSASWDNIAITRLSYNRDYGGIAVDSTKANNNVFASSLPSGAIASTADRHYFSSLTTSGKATMGSASIGGNDVAAVVVATNNGNASNTSWGYRKHSDGTCDLWAYKHINEACSTALGSWYRSGNISMQDLPFSVSAYVFTYGFEIESDSGALLWNVKGISGTSGPKFYAIRPTSGAAKGWITVHVHGKWK